MVRIIKAAMGYAAIPAGFPILVSERMAVIEPAFAWLMKLATIPGRSHAAETVRTYGEHLHDWFDSLEQSGLDWRGVSEAEIAACRNRMLSQPSPHTKRPYARSTVNDRVRTVCRFYGWAQGRGWIEVLPFHFVDVRVGCGRRQSFLAHVEARPGMAAANILTVAEHERLPRPLRVDQLRRVFAHLDMPYRLMAEWALATGLRRKELCGLAVFQVPETAHLDDEDHPLIGVPLTITKGDKPRTIYPPIRLVDRTQRYIDEIHTPQVRALRRQRPDYRAPSALFLNTPGKRGEQGAIDGGVCRGVPRDRCDGNLALPEAHIRDDHAGAPDAPSQVPGPASPWRTSIRCGACGTGEVAQQKPIPARWTRLPPMTAVVAGAAGLAAALADAVS